MANHAVSFCKWLPSEILCFHISASTVVAMALGVPRADFLESHHLTRQMNTPWLNLFPCRVERIVRTGSSDHCAIFLMAFSCRTAHFPCSLQVNSIAVVAFLVVDIILAWDCPKCITWPAILCLQYSLLNSYNYKYCTSPITLDSSLLNMQYQIKV